LRHFDTLMTIAYFKTRGYACARALLPRLVSAQLFLASRASDRYQDREYNKRQLVAWLQIDSVVQVTEGPDGVLRIL
jgi:hypothetical protein